jgi:hypothetical protein
VDDFIKLADFIVGLATLGFLFWYTVETWKLRKTAQEQIAVSHDLLRAANDQAEGISKPCMTIRGKLRDATSTLLHMDDAVSGVLVGDEAGHYVAVNIGNGIAMNVSYFFKARRDSDKPWVKVTGSYLPGVLPNHSQQIQLALLVNSHPGENEITFLFQSLGGRWYESVVTVKSKVIVDFGMKQLPASFRPDTSELP